MADPAVFDARYYLDHNPDLGAAGICTEVGARQHWVHYGVSEGRSGRADFDPNTYLHRYSDLLAAYGQDTRAATQHYLAYGIAEGRSGAPEGVPGPTDPQAPASKDSALSLKNTNLRLYDADNRDLGTIGSGEPSGWGVKQWHTRDLLTPSGNGVRTDPELGTARQSLVSPSSALAIYDDPASPGSPVYELATAGGQNSNYGAQNLFLQKELDPPVAVAPGAVIDLDYKISYAAIQKTAAFDAKNLAQLHLGMVLRNEQTGETLFLQKEMFESNNRGTTTHVDGDPNDPQDRGTHVGLCCTSMRPGEDLSTPPNGWVHARIDVSQQLQDALSKEFAIQGGGSYRYQGTNPADWKLTAVYYGTETAGTGVLTTQIKNLELT
ncbi:MAG: hypothetical protein HY901_03585 [Deltaproteobacteria bacterium]|nr:hypothetical protein [Deltaproteobacteria bacterium]